MSLSVAWRRTPLFPNFDQDRDAMVKDLKYQRRRVTTPEPNRKDVVANLRKGQTLYYVNVDTGETRCIW
jgi:hypothetical protein